MIYEENSLFELLKNNIIEDGIHTINLSNGESIDFEIYNFYEDMEYSTTPILGDEINDKKMLILLYHKNLIINSSVSITPQARKKGMLIFCKGEMVIDGIVSMTSKGSIDEGQNVVLVDDEIVPAIGASGNVRQSAWMNAIVHGAKGINGINRQSGSGGNGGLSGWRRNSGGQYSSIGSAGTSYRGGSGGGGVRIDVNRQDMLVYTNSDANSYKGGPGLVYQENSGTPLSSGGGAGVSQGIGAYVGGTGWYCGNNTSYNGSKGAGGLLIIFCNKISGSGYIRSRGNNGGGGWSGGGNSGGGSINLFYFSKNDFPTSNIQAEGGISINGLHAKGGYGGDGCITVTPMNSFFLINNKYKKYSIYKDSIKEFTNNDFFGISSLRYVTKSISQNFRKFRINKVINK